MDGDFAALDALLNGADGSAGAAASVGETVLAPDDPFAELQNMLGLGDEESWQPSPTRQLTSPKALGHQRQRTAPL